MQKVMDEERNFKMDINHEDHLLMACSCSVFCFDCDKPLNSNSPIINKKCGVYCPKCNHILCQKCPGFRINNLGNAVCFDCRKVICKKDQTPHFCLDFKENCAGCCRNFHHEMYGCKTCKGEACWTCKTLYNEGINGYFRVNSCGIVCGDKECKKIIHLADDHKESDVYRNSRYWYCKKCNN